MNLLKIKVWFMMAYFWIFKPQLYRDGRRFQKAMKSPEVQEALDKAAKALIDGFASKARARCEFM